MVYPARMTFLFGVALLAVALRASAQSPPSVGVEERLGEVVPLEALTFIDENGKPLALRSLFDRPVILALVYLRCPSICTPLLQELARNVNESDLTPGEDYRLLTVSFDPTERDELARLKKAELLTMLDKKTVSPEDWRFLTGEQEAIRQLADAVGFHYVKDENGIDYVHAATIIFLSADGRIVRYLHGLQFNPADLKMAVIDASAGRARSFIQKMQQLCYAYDPAARGYVLKMNRIILGVTVVFALSFGAFLLLKKKHSGGTRDSDGGEHP